MKAIVLIACILSATQAVEMDAAPQQEPGQMMMMMMYMQFWTGTEINFWFKNWMSMSTGSFLVGLVGCFVASIAFELLMHMRGKMYKGTLLKLAANEADSA